MKKISKYLIISGIILIIISSLLLINNKYKGYQAKKKSQEVLEVIEKENPDKLKRITNEEDLQEIIIDGYGYIGTLEIPALNLKLPVTSSVDYEKLNTAPGRYYGSTTTNDLVICAHDYKYHFGNINKLLQGDIIKFKDINNKEYLYQVEVIELLDPSNVTEMIESEFDLTLYTCNYDGLKRITVRCKRLYDYT